MLVSRVQALPYCSTESGGRRVERDVCDTADGRVRKARTCGVGTGFERSERRRRLVRVEEQKMRDIEGKR
jgi:hypothetical protein